MDGKQLRIMERVANNLPVATIYKARARAKFGDIYMAYGYGFGEDNKPCWHAMWALDTIPTHLEGPIEELAQVGIELTRNLTEKEVEQTLFDMAHVVGSVYGGD